MARLSRWLALAGAGALGHLAGVAWVAAAAMSGGSLDRGVLQAVAGGLLVAMLLHAAWRARAPARHGALALGSFLLSSAHGAGLMLVPALAPLCLGSAPEDGPAADALMLALAGIVAHIAAMLALTGLAAAGWAATGRWLNRSRAAVATRACID